MNSHPDIHDRLMTLFSRLEGLELRRAPLSKKLDLSMAQFGILATVQRKPGLQVHEVAKTLGVSTPTVSVAIRKLEKQGWLRRQDDPEDGRAACLFLSKKASLIAQRAKAFRRKRINEFMKALTDQEQDQLLNLLEKAISHIEKKHSAN
ncbi:MAG: MarR family winged helix-turn-helix transcriptional regulator [Anaerolineales bacterium]